MANKLTMKKRKTKGVDLFIAVQVQDKMGERTKENEAKASKARGSLEGRVRAVDGAREGEDVRRARHGRRLGYDGLAEQPRRRSRVQRIRLLRQLLLVVLVWTSSPRRDCRPWALAGASPVSARRCICSMGRWVSEVLPSWEAVRCRRARGGEASNAWTDTGTRRVHT